MVSATAEALQESHSESAAEHSDTLPVDHEALLEQANGVIKRNVAWSAGAGLVPLPLLDIAAVTGVQLKMISDLCGVYGIPFKQSLARPIVVSLIGSLGAGVLAPALAVTTLKLLPGIGTLFTGASMSATSAGITYAVGHLFLDHFKSGGTLENFNLIVGRKRFKQKVEEAAKSI